MKVISRNEFLNIINDVGQELQQDLYVLFWCYRTRTEAEQARIEDLNLELYQMDWLSCCHIWLHNWESLKNYDFIAFEGIYTMDQLIEFIMKGSDENDS